ncbi:GTPase-activating protein, partial [Cladochytrium tenue]
SPELETTYRTLLTRTSLHEKQIVRDLARTFPKHEHFAEVGGPGQESLYNVIKAYSLFDPEVGYCQGLAFIAGPLLLNLEALQMPDEEAFCVLVKLMKGYNFRELFTKSMSGLQLRLYQFDRLLEETLPAVAKHLESQDIKSTMYASQWFMTLFAYRFPLDIVFRIMDIVLAEGLEAIFRFSFALLRRNQEVIQTLEFEALLEFLKVGLFDVYGDNVNALIQQAAAEPLSKARLDRLAQEHRDVQRQTGAGADEAMSAGVLRGENRRLQDALRKLEAGYEGLNREHVELARRHLETAEAAERAAQRVEELEGRADALQAAVAAERAGAEAGVADEARELAARNVELARHNSELEDRAEQLQARAGEARARAEALRHEVSDLRGKWDALRAALRA